MTTFSLATNTTAATANTAALEIIAGTDSAKVVEIILNLATATASTYALGVPAAVGLIPTTPVALLSENNLVSITVATVATAWGTPPTSPTIFLKRSSLAGTVGSQIVWTFPNGLLISAGSSLVVWNLATNSASTDISVRTSS